jgi:hypothetical protein
MSTIRIPENPTPLMPGRYQARERCHGTADQPDRRGKRSPFLIIHTGLSGSKPSTCKVRMGSGSKVHSLFGMSGYVRIAALSVASQVCHKPSFCGLDIDVTFRPSTIIRHALPAPQQDRPSEPKPVEITPNIAGPNVARATRRARHRRSLRSCSWAGFHWISDRWHG